MEYYSAIKKNEILPFIATETIILSEVRQISYDIIYTWNIIFKRYKLIYKTETDLDTENQLTVTKREIRQWGRGIHQKLGMNLHTRYIYGK